MFRLLFFFALILSSCAAPPPPRVLIFSRTNGYRHQSIEAGKETLVKLCYQHGIQADTTENPIYFNERNLKRYAAVVFLNTNGDVLNPAQEADFERYIQAGGGFMGVHSASATEYTWRWFGSLLGAYFKDHPAIQEVDLHPNDCRHPATEHLQCNRWTWKEELYNFRNYEPDIQVLLSVNDTAFKGSSSPPGTDSTVHPLSWCHTFDGGRAFYTALGHIPEAYDDPAFQQHLLGGLRYAIGDNKPLNYARCRTQRLPDQTRFVKTVVADQLSEPMEIAELPDGKILLIERHGQLKMFNPATDLLTTVVKLPVYSEMGDGLMGLAIDPNWEKNHWIYLYYSSLRDSMNQLSRFIFQGDTLDRSSETVFFTIPVGHKDCFHAAGSITFDGQGNL
ncbi:MAG: ThuA domain-containing protein, partial [Saprospiraceae bacterium]|nr:ThuA domain-containing protein [Saprospiraceae bacterium]